jgi:hypothetical protein
MSMHVQPLLAAPNREGLLARFPEQDLELMICSAQDADHALRAQMESVVVGHFARIYGASVSRFMPLLLGLRQQGQILAVVGLRPAGDEALFLEQYLDEPVPQMISRRGLSAPRETVIEVGNLVSTSPGLARLLIVALTHYLHSGSFQWVAFTGTPALLNSFSRLTLSPIDLGAADPARLGVSASEWGSYYDTHPHVMAGYIPEGFAQLCSKQIFQRLGYQPHYQFPEQSHCEQESHYVCA